MRARMSQKEKRFLSQARVCRIGSVSRRGETHTAPLCHAFDAATRTAYVTTDADGTTARNLRARRRAAIECDDYFEDWDRLRGLVAHARARVVRGKERERAQSLLKRKFEQYRDQDLPYVIALRLERVTSWGL
jgi:nitroimidazol reductase NimA-like FMN-containing flavoprotein (pyridoxamine 5'-phosphate oxidase superfamily)